MKNKLKEIKSILSSNIADNDIFNNVALDNYSLCLENWNNVHVYKNTDVDLGLVKVFEPRKREAFNPEGKPKNIHTIWLSNNENWKDYPKRDHAIIMSTENPQPYFGDYCYKMLIPNNIKIAICEDRDFLLNYADEHPSHLSVYDFNTSIYNYLEDLSYHYHIKFNKENIEQNYKYFINLIRKLDNNQDKIIEDLNQNKINFINSSNDLKIINMIYGEFEGFEDFINSYYDPSYIQLKNTPEFINEYDDRQHEIWVDIPCIGINMSTMKRDLQSEEVIYLKNFLDKYE